MQTLTTLVRLHCLDRVTCRTYHLHVRRASGEDCVRASVLARVACAVRTQALGTEGESTADSLTNPSKS